MIGKAFLPKSLFGRALLILVLPTVLIQLVMAYVFFDRHWDNVTRHMASALAGETAFLVEQLKQAKANMQPNIVANFEQATGMDVYLAPPHPFETSESKEFSEYQTVLREKIAEPFSVRKIEDGAMVETRVLLPKYTLRIETSIKRLESRTTIIFMVWMLGTSILFLLIAVLFLRNQIRPIRRLATAAENFGRGVDTPNFRPHGASEVRQAARAFIVMRERLKRQIRTRTDMLAGISHDLRTPLTRMKLQLAMLPESEANSELGDDVHQMERMIEEYLDFARGEGREEAEKTNINELIADVVADYRRMGTEIALTASDATVMMDIRPSGFRRMLHNVIDNAIRYGKRCHLSARATGSSYEIRIDDEGPGIPRDKHDEVFKPFLRLDPSRNVKTGGVGLGLTIARDIVFAHGGAIVLETSPAGGLRVLIRLPIEGR